MKKFENILNYVQNFKVEEGNGIGRGNSYFKDGKFIFNSYVQRKQMPLASEYKKTYEKTPFFSDKTVPELVNKFNSSIKLIVMIRDPVTRTISGFTHAMSKIKKKINPNRYSSSSRLFEEYVFDVNDTVVNFNLIRRGRYVESYNRWLKYFPIEQILVLDGENFIKNPYDEIIKMEWFLDLKLFFKKENFIYDKSKGFFCLKKNLKSVKLECMGDNKGRDHPFILDSVLVELRNYFAPYDKALFELIGDKPFWKT